VGPFGRYQKLLLAAMCLASCVTGQATFATPFLFYQDPYQCATVPSDFLSCSDYVCSLPSAERTPFSPLPEMLTLSTRFGDFRCPQ
jgi:hypothetical protein